MNTTYKYKRRPEKAQRKRSRIRSFVTILQVIILLGLSASVGIGLGLFVSLSRMLPTLGDFKSSEATIIYSSDGVILGQICKEYRNSVALKDMPQSLRNASIAIEDRRFYQHSGLDYHGIARAIWSNIRKRKAAEGASTITQQLARNVYLSQRKTIQRKVEEAMLALMIERNFTKEKILELYLNQVYYGSGAFGVQAASKIYFDKDVDQLDLAESALIAGLPQKPSGYSPHEDLEAAVGRRNVVLSRMNELGYITVAERDRAQAEKPRIIAKKSGRNVYKASHFVDWITQILRQRGYGDDVIYAGGLRVWTTLSYDMQKVAEKALREGVRKRERRHRVTEGCFVAIEPATGFVRAMVGSVDPASQFNRCTQALRQPGSSFKAFVYTAAIQNGMTPRTMIHIPKGGHPYWPNGTGENWIPKNYDGVYYSNISMLDAVAKSVNTAAICVADEVSIRNVIKYAHLMGITTEIAPYLPTAIGASAVHPIEMASAYGTFANGGVHVNICPIIRVTDSHGETIEDCQPEATRVITENKNKMMDELFRGVVTRPRGTGRSVASIKDARGKTGTTNEDRDAWFIGYIPGKMVAACWVGNDNNTPMSHASGSALCAPVWREFMQKSIPIYDKIQKELREQEASKNPVKPKVVQVKPRQERNPSDNPNSPKPDVIDNNSDTVSVRICEDSQLLATANCPATRTERVMRGTEPTTYCTVHSSDNSPDNPDENTDSRDNTDTSPPANTTMITVTVCSESGMLATPNCPNRVRKRVPVDQVPSQICTTHGRSGSRE